ncbi:pentapeptide repeat-containing protein [Mycolicibacterium septicum]|uniref:pentapeptide repeat-containing protein n=1 Tax=Mycolicibacterium septicum TaxID=98668 RepID=UPI0023E0B322|nr:pentapeptide repeat-containing protein [Mycolicibacterium septicum]MDF3339514.1 pentapeptide repeat-containing protein [Mycolicibacterium septicum]
MGTRNQNPALRWAHSHSKDIFIGGALAAAAIAGVLTWWLLGKPRTAEAAQVVWHWLTPGWVSWGRFALALVAAAISSRLVMAARRSCTNAPRGSRRTRQWALFPTVVGAVALGLLLVGAGYMAITHALHANAGAPPTRIDVLKTALTAVAGVGGAVALVVAYRRQHDLEQGRFIERFGAAAAQLGNSDPAVRIAGVYALASAADEATTDGRRQQCIDVLCGYLRLPYEPGWGESHHTEIVTAAKPPATAVIQTGREVTFHQKLRQNDREVRQTVMRVIAAHLGQDVDYSWSSRDFDFTGVVFEETYFQGATFTGDAHFNNAIFTRETRFEKATFKGDTHFDNATFKGDTHFDNATFLSDAHFSSANFAGKVQFNDCKFNRHAIFKDAKFVRNALFKDAAFSREAIFINASFTHNAVFTSVLFFDDAVFNNTTFRRKAWFNDRTIFIGEAQFSSAIFTLQTSFVNATFRNNARFKLAKFAGEAHFSKSIFKRSAVFENVDFKGNTYFKNATFTQPKAIFDSAIFKDKAAALKDAVFVTG